MRHSLMTLAGRRQRKRRKVSPESCEDDFNDEVIDVDLESVDSPEHQSFGALSLDDKGEFSKEIHDDIAWVQRYASLESQTGLVVSAKKKNEVVDWLRRALDFSGPRLAVLGGPPGCGKSSVVQAAGKELHCRIASWQAPFVGSRGVCRALLDDFRAFFVGSRYSTLPLEDGDEDEEQSARSIRHALLVEDLPIHVTDIEQNKEALRKIFFDAAQFAPHPTIVILSDGDKGIAKLARLLLGLHLLSSPVVQSIKIPAVTDKMMKRRLREVLTVENLSISPRQLDLVVSTSRGDMRAALNCLQFSSALEGDAGLDDLVRNSRKRHRSRPMHVSPLIQISHDLTLSTYHAVSKILNNKREQGGVSKYVAEEILDEARTDPTAFLSFLHQNYLQFFGNADDIVPTLLCLSEADTFMPWIQEGDLRTDLSDCAASVATRAFLYFNSCPVRSGWRPIRGPESREVSRESRFQVEHARMILSKALRPQVFARSDSCETVAYAAKIKQCSIKRWKYSRDDSTIDTPSIAHAADIAVVDFESTGTDQPVPFTSDITNATSYPSNLRNEEDEEEIEDWED